MVSGMIHDWHLLTSHCSTLAFLKYFVSCGICECKSFLSCRRNSLGDRLSILRRITVLGAADATFVGIPGWWHRHPLVSSVQNDDNRVQKVVPIIEPRRWLPQFYCTRLSSFLVRVAYSIECLLCFSGAIYPGTTKIKFKTVVPNIDPHRWLQQLIRIWLSSLLIRVVYSMVLLSIC